MCCAAQCFPCVQNTHTLRIQAKHIVLGFSERSTAASAVVNSGTVGRTLVFSPKRRRRRIAHIERRRTLKAACLREKAVVASIIWFGIYYTFVATVVIFATCLHAQDLHCSLPGGRADSSTSLPNEPASHLASIARLTGSRRAASDRSVERQPSGRVISMACKTVMNRSQAHHCVVSYVEGVGRGLLFGGRLTSTRSPRASFPTTMTTTPKTITKMTMTIRMALIDYKLPVFPLAVWVWI